MSKYVDAIIGHAIGRLRYIERMRIRFCVV